jgi:integrase
MARRPADADRKAQALVAPATGALPVAALSALDAAAEGLARNAVAANTVRAYESDWESWCGFCRRHGFLPLPADPEHVRLYLAQLVDFGGRKGERLRPKTAQRHVAAIAAAHRAKDLAFDTKHPALKRALDGIRRTYGDRQDGASALRTPEILKLCGTFALDARSVRNKAIVLLGFAGGFRRSELVALDLEDLRFKPEGLEILVGRGKTDQTGVGRLVGILPGANPESCPIAAVRAWLRTAELEGDEGPLFRPINRWGSIEFTRLGDKAVDRVVKEACQRAGITGHYSAHSLRAGHVTEARARGADRVAVKRQTGHASDAMVDRYDREANLFVNNSSGSLGL